MSRNTQETRQQGQVVANAAAADKIIEHTGGVQSWIAPLTHITSQKDGQQYNVSSLGSLFKVDFSNRLKTGDAISVQHQELSPVVTILNVQEGPIAHIVKGDLGATQPEKTLQTCTSTLQDSDILERVYSKEESCSTLNTLATELVNHGIKFSYRWHQSPPRAVCWFHHHRPASIVCTITDRNFCSKACYQASFIQIKNLLCSQELIHIPTGNNAMTRGLVRQIESAIYNPEGSETYESTMSLLGSLGIDAQAARTWDIVPKSPAIWPAPSHQESGGISLNKSLCSGFIREERVPYHSHLHALCVGQYPRLNTFLQDLGSLVDTDVGALAYEMMRQPFYRNTANGTFMQGNGGIPMSRLWEFYRHLRSLKISVSPIERNNLYWEVCGTNRNLTPTSAHIGRELRFTVKLGVREEGRLALAPSESLNPTGNVHIGDVLERATSQRHSVEKSRNTWTGQTSVTVPEGNQKSVCGTMISVPDPTGSSMKLEYTNDGFSVVSWNILSDIYSTEDMFHHVTPSYLKWDYRKHFILSQLQSLNPDIICFQELQNDHFGFFEEHLRVANLGYAGFYKSKRLDQFNANSCLARGSAGTYVSDGCGIFYKANKFQPVMLVHADYGHLIGGVINSLGGMSSLENLVQGFFEANQDRGHFKPVDIAKDTRQRLFKDNVLQYLALEVNPEYGTELNELDKANRYAESMAFHQHCLSMLYDKCPPPCHPMEKPEPVITMEDASTKPMPMDEFTFKEADEIEGNVILIGNTHILANPEISDTKFWQSSLFMKNLDRIAEILRTDLQMRRKTMRSVVKSSNVEPEKVPQLGVVICGDFNSMPGSIVYSYIINGVADPNHPELENDKRGLLRIACNLPDLKHRLKVRSMNAEGICTERGLDINRYYQSPEEQSYLKPYRHSLGLVEPVWTNSTPSFTGCLDYIFYEHKDIRCSQVLRLPTQNNLHRESMFNCTISPHLPMVNRPSDHVPVFGKFEWRRPGQEGSANNNITVVVPNGHAKMEGSIQISHQAAHGAPMHSGGTGINTTTGINSVHQGRKPLNLYTTMGVTGGGELYNGYSYDGQFNSGRLKDNGNATQATGNPTSMSNSSSAAIACGMINIDKGDRIVERRGVNRSTSRY